MISSTSLVFAAAAIAALWWFNRHPGAAAESIALPPLSPIPMAPVSRPAHTEPTSRLSPAGVSPLLLGVILLPWGLMAWSHLAKPEPKPDDPSPIEGIDLRGKFLGEHAAEDASTVAVLTLQTAEAIHDDGQIDFDGDGRIDEPRLLTGRQIWELRNLMRSYHTGGELLGDRQPKVRDEIKRYLDERCGKSSGPVTPETKRVWEDAFRVINRAAVEATR
jgi:hypothetical protein